MKLKDSRIDWIGEIPSHWEVSKIKYQTYINKHTLNDQTSDDYIIQYIDIGNVNSEGRIQGLQKYKFSDAPSRARRIVKKNDLLISTVRTYLKAITSILDDVEDNVICSTGFAVLTPKNTMDPLYLHYLSRSEIYIDEIVSKSTGVSYPAINASDIGALECILPPLDEQQMIGKFLYKKSSEVELLIQLKLKYIMLLEQQRQSIITEAVTKGINSNVKMKDSGVEWIGEIPEHWKLTKIKYVAKLLNGDRGENYPSGNDFVEDGVPFITSHNLSNRYVDESNLKFITEKRYSLLRGIKIKKNDIIYCLRGSVGKNSLVTRDGGTVASSLMGIRANTKVNAEFLLYILNSKMEVWNRSMLTTGSVSDNLSAENVGTYLFTFPDLNEQMEIVNYLNSEMLKMEKLLMIIGQQIEKLKKYRQSLIYEAVTGKIDVREMEID